MKYRVCIRCYTYNQANYIQDTLDGFCMQETSFPFICCIVDDASTDGEQKVINKYVEDNFDCTVGSCFFNRETDYAFISYAQHKTNKNCFFAILYLKENHYSSKKPKLQYLEEWRKECEYDALCEGDDYWSHPYKLQIQVDFLDIHPECGMTYSKVSVLKNSQISGIWGNNLCNYKDILLENNIPTLSVMLRRSEYEEYIEKFQSVLTQKQWPMGDKQIWLWMAVNSKIYYIDINIGVYRQLENSASHTNDFKKKIRFTEAAYDVNCYFDNYFFDGANMSIINNRYYRDMLKLHCNTDGNLLQAIRFFWKINNLSKNEYKLLFKKIINSLLYYARIVIKD